MRRTTAAVLAVALATLCGCGPSQDERHAIVDEAWRETVTIADQAVTTLIELRPDLALTEVDDDPTGQRWIDCSGSITGNAVSPTEIMWSALRDVEIEPPRETAGLAEALATRFEEHGWLVLDVRDHNGGQTISLNRDSGLRDDYDVSIIFQEVEPTNRPAQVRIIVNSPCVRAPERMIDWATPTPTPAGSPS